MWLWDLPGYEEHIKNFRKRQAEKEPYGEGRYDSDGETLSDAESTYCDEYSF